MEKIPLYNASCWMVKTWYQSAGQHVMHHTAIDWHW